MVVSMEYRVHAHRSRQVVEDFEAVGMPASSFMGNQDIGLLFA